LLFGDEEAVLDGVDAAFDRMLNAFGAGRVGEGLPAVLFRGGDDLAHFLDRHLRRVSAPGRP
jgi:hypothetical protein